MTMTTTHPEMQDTARWHSGAVSVQPLIQPISQPRAAANELVGAAEPARQPARRLVVLVPDADVDEAGMAAHIWRLASPAQMDVLFLGLMRAPREEAYARRRLASLAAITRDPALHVESRLSRAGDWLAAVRSVAHADDLIVCPTELRTRGLRPAPVAERLLAASAARVYGLAGFYPALRTERPAWVQALTAWVPALAILAAFFVLQANLVQATTGALQTVLLMLTVGVEFLLISAWEQSQAGR